jgi:hypothetical protein
MPVAAHGRRERGNALLDVRQPRFYLCQSRFNIEHIGLKRIWGGASAFKARISALNSLNSSFVSILSLMSSKLCFIVTARLSMMSVTISLTLFFVASWLYRVDDDFFLCTGLFSYGT